jgi:hypothetical protein
LWVNALPDSGIITPGSIDSILYSKIDSSGFPGTIEYLYPPLPLPVATGFLNIPKLISLVSFKCKYNPVELALPVGE